MALAGTRHPTTPGAWRSRAHENEGRDVSLDVEWPVSKTEGQKSYCTIGYSANADPLLYLFIETWKVCSGSRYFFPQLFVFLCPSTPLPSTAYPTDTTATMKAYWYDNAEVSSPTTTISQLTHPLSPGRPTPPPRLQPPRRPRLPRLPRRPLLLAPNPLHRRHARVPALLRAPRRDHRLAERHGRSLRVQSQDVLQRAPARGRRDPLHP